MSDETRSETILFEGNPAAIPSLPLLLVVIGTMGIAWLFLILRAKKTHYKITSHRVVVETGLLSKKLNQVDLYRIVDYSVERPFGQRLLGTGNLVIETLDKTSPELRVEGIQTDVVALYEKLRIATEQEKTRRNVRLVDMESSGGSAT